MDVTLALQKAVVAALRGDAAFDAAAEVWDRVPQGTAAPYVQIDYLTKAPWPARRLGWECSINLQVWSGEGGAAEALEIVALVDAVLDVDHATSGLTATGFEIVRLWNEYTDTAPRGEDGVTRGVPMRFRAWVQPAS